MYRLIDRSTRSRPLFIAAGSTYLILCAVILVALGRLSRDLTGPVLLIVQLTLLYALAVLTIAVLTSPLDLEIGPERISLKSRFEQRDMYWRRVRYVYARRALDERDGVRARRLGWKAAAGTSDGFGIVLQPDPGLGPQLTDVVVVPPGLLTPRVLEHTLEVILEQCDSSAVDSGVALLYGASRRLAARPDSLPNPTGLVNPASVAQISSADGDLQAARAAFLYSSGRTSAAVAAIKLARKAGVDDWDVRLCSALCDRSVDAKWTTASLAPILEGADTPPRVKAVLESAVTTDPRDWYNPHE